jgi:tetratricopeptide (TPR) repeat protein
MRGNLVRPILLTITLVLVAGAAWFLVAKVQLESRYSRDVESADRLVDEGSYAEAIPHLEKSLDSARKFDSRDPRLDDALNKLAEAYSAQGNYVESQHLLFGSFQNRIEKYGLAHPETADILLKLARSYELQDLPDVAAGMYNQAIEAWVEMKRPDDPQATAAYLGLARVLAKRERYEAAVANHAKAVAIQEKALGADSPKLKPLLEAYSGLLAAAGRTAEAEQMKERAQRLADEAPASDSDSATAPAATATAQPQGEAQ